MHALDVVRFLDGIATYSEITRLASRADLRASVRNGDLTHLRRGIYAATTNVGWPEWQRRLAASLGGTLSHLSAACWYGWQVRTRPKNTSVTLRPNHHGPYGSSLALGSMAADSRSPGGSHFEGTPEFHWASLDSDQTHRWVTSKPRTVIDCARSLRFDEALATADSALRTKSVNRMQLMRELHRATGLDGASKARRVIALADPGAANPFESVLRAIAMTVPGLSVQAQQLIPGVGRVDLFDPQVGLVIEADSVEFHSSAQALQKDMTRYTACARLGLKLARFSWVDVMLRPEYVREALIELVERYSPRGHRRKVAPIWLNDPAVQPAARPD